jgi:outer membrane lipoprotein carrier protein
MQLLKSIVSLLSLPLALGAYASDDGGDIQQLRDLLEPIVSLSAQFEQHMVDANGVELQQSNGLFQVAKPNSLRWIVEQPMPQQVISDGNSLWVYDPDLEQVMVQPFTGDIQSAPAMLFSGDLQALDSAYMVEQLSAGSFLLTAEQGTSLFSSVQIDFDNLLPTSIALTDNLGQVTRISFSELEYNPPLGADLFVFEIPLGVDVIRND